MHIEACWRARGTEARRSRFTARPLFCACADGPTHTPCPPRTAPQHPRAM